MTFLDTRPYPFVRLLESSFESIRVEAERLVEADFSRWVVEDAFSGDWLIFPLFFNDDASDLPAQCEGNRARCPETTAVLNRIPGLLSGGFSWLGPRSRVHPHHDFPGTPAVRTHLTIRAPQGCYLDMDGDVRSWQPGHVFSFDGRTTHTAENPTDESRVVLLVDVEMSRAGDDVL